MVDLSWVGMPFRVSIFMFFFFFFLKHLKFRELCISYKIPMIWPISTLHKSSILGTCFHWFSMLFWNRFQRVFLEGPSTDIASTGRFWQRFQSWGFPKSQLFENCVVRPMIFKVSALQKSLIFGISIFFMFFRNRFQRVFLEGPGADLTSTGRFWCRFRSWGFPQSQLFENLLRPTGR